MLSLAALSILASAALVSANDAVHANPPPDNTVIGLTEHGSDFLWAVFAIMLLSDLVFIGWSFKLPRGERIFHQLPIIILTTASVAYFSLASNLGQTPIPTEFNSQGGRAIWYVRYIDWVITTPLLLLELLLGTGLSLSDIVVTLFFDIAMIVVGLVGALVISSYKWGFWTFGMFFEFYIWWVLLGPGRETAGILGADVKKAYTVSALVLSGLWLLYPVAWALADGSNTISVTGEMVFYGILDVLAKPVFCFIHVAAIAKIPFGTFGLTGGSLHGGHVGGAGAGPTSYGATESGSSTAHGTGPDVKKPIAPAS